jgi:hypothetical protein
MLMNSLAPLFVRIGRAELIQALTSAGYLVVSAGLLWASLETHSRALLPGAVAVTLTGAAAAWYLANRRFHLIHDTPTARVRSAAQGYVELMGIADLSPGQHLLAFNGLPPCVWFEVVISRRGHAGSIPSTWTRISDETFVLRDDTGACIIDPDYAEVHMAHVRRWSSDGCRYHARFLRQGDPLYVIGALETLRAADGGYDRRTDVAHLLREWKRDPGSLRRRFDSDRDGRISTQEWQQAVAEAERIIDATYQEHNEQPDVNIMRAPGSGLPFILSNQDPETLARRFRHWSWFHAGTFLSALSAGAWFAVS